MGLRRGERLRAPVERLPVGQSRAFLLHVHRIPPFLDRDHAGLVEIDRLAGRERRLHRVLAGGLPYLHRDVQIAALQARELRDVIGLHVLDVVAHLIEHRAHDVGGDVLAGPVVDGELDRILRLHGRRGRRAGEPHHGQHCHREPHGRFLHRLSPFLVGDGHHTFQSRRPERKEARQRIAAFTAARIGGRDTPMMDAGSTTACVALIPAEGGGSPAP